MVQRDWQAPSKCRRMVLLAGASLMLGGSAHGFSAAGSASQGTTQVATSAGSTVDRWIMEEPFWTTGKVRGESLLFVQHEPTQRPRASLLFIPAGINRLRSATGEVTYEPGRDYLWQEGSRWIELPRGSRIPFKTADDLHPLPGTPNSYPSVRGEDRHILFGEGHFYHDMQAQVDYHAVPQERDWPVKVRRLRPGELPRTHEKLEEGEPLSIALFGDSISAGSNASAFTKALPRQPAYGDLVVAELASRSGSEISFTNYSRGGKTSQWGLENVAPIAEGKHDLVLLAWGMNDISTNVSPESFQKHIADQMRAIREMNPEVEFLLISSMRANPVWSGSSPELFPQYVEALQELTDDRAVLADVTSVWTEMLRRKSFYDLTGNGVNHPNDFGHRVYAQVVLSRLTQEKSASSTADDVGKRE